MSLAIVGGVQAGHNGLVHKNHASKYTIKETPMAKTAKKKVVTKKKK